MNFMIGPMLVASAATHVSPPPAIPLADRLAMLAANAAGTGWAADVRTLTRAQLIQAASLLGFEARAERVLVGLVEAHTLQWSVHREQTIALHVHRFKDAASARRYLDLALDCCRQQDERWSQANGRGPYVIADSRCASLPTTIAGAQAVRASKHVRLPGGDALIPLTSDFIQFGATCVEISYFGVSPVDEWEAELIRLLAE